MKKKNTNETKMKSKKVEVIEDVIEEEMPKDLDKSSDDSEEEEQDTRKLVQQQNRKNKKSGGFQSMGLSYSVYKGIIRKGYKIPTPIQRKAIPMIMDGRDVVAMARTGSGKTAAFLLPLFEKLKIHVPQGARALILAPTRELALQTLTFTKELGKFTDLRAAVILGGDSMNEQFSAIHENPDIIIATPGRFLHVIMEMDLKLQSVEYVVFDEADRLFEMGFKDQLHEILGRLPVSRQTLLFSATLPSLLVEFSRAGLNDPILVRLDVDNKLSENLQMAFVQCRNEDKIAVLLYFLRNIVKPAEQTLVFVATKHHVEYLSLILNEAGIYCTVMYSALDQTCRKINAAKFRNKITPVMIVTDLAARGIDIPMLDNVINFNFPPKPKLFVHRVGRVARAGQIGTAYSFICPDEISYVIDLHSFIGKPLQLVTPSTSYDKEESGLYGRIPQSMIDDEDENLRKCHSKTDLINLKNVADRGYGKYIRSRPPPSQESIKRSKVFAEELIRIHPMFDSVEEKTLECQNLLEKMKNFRPSHTIFEINSTSKSDTFPIMKQKRECHEKVIEANKNRLKLANTEEKENEKTLEPSTDADLEEVFNVIVNPKYRELKEKKKKKFKKFVRDENYINYTPKNMASEKGLAVESTFQQQASKLQLDLVGDDSEATQKIKSVMKWDRKRKRFIGGGGESQGKKKMKTESGAIIPASYKSNLYEGWLKKAKPTENVLEFSDSEEKDSKPKYKSKKNSFKVLGSSHNSKGTGHHKLANKGNQNYSRHERKSKEEILKQRKANAKREANMQKRKGKKGNHRNR